VTYTSDPPDLSRAWSARRLWIGLSAAMPAAATGLCGIGYEPIGVGLFVVLGICATWALFGLVFAPPKFGLDRAAGGTQDDEILGLDLLFGAAVGLGVTLVIACIGLTRGSQPNDLTMLAVMGCGGPLLFGLMTYVAFTRLRGGWALLGLVPGALAFLAVGPGALGLGLLLFPYLIAAVPVWIVANACLSSLKGARGDRAAAVERTGVSLGFVTLPSLVVGGWDWPFRLLLVLAAAAAIAAGRVIARRRKEWLAAVARGEVPGRALEAIGARSTEALPVLFAARSRAECAHVLVVTGRDAYRELSRRPIALVP
jgi:hypothetical protein